MEVMRGFLAAGLSLAKSTLFVQSAIPAHSELAWILNTITPMGELRRMTQFKEKLGAGTESNANVGLFDYPVLMAADVLLYDAAVVPVGDDQDQHLELARTLARKFNARFGKTFAEPKAFHAEVPRLMSLDDPTKKMSKSRPAGCLFMEDSPSIIREKLARATTDSGKEVKYDEKNKPGISNLLLIYSSLSGASIPSLEKKYAGKGYAAFKHDVAEVVVEALTPYQTKKEDISVAAAKAVFAKGSTIAVKRAEKKMIEVKRKIGLI
jgi:tryptophanyl-tRNA synthetase